MQRREVLRAVGLYEAAVHHAAQAWDKARQSGQLGARAADARCLAISTGLGQRMAKRRLQLSDVRQGMVAIRATWQAAA